MKPGIPAVEHAEPAQTLFQRQWQIYRKSVENNYLFHREAYYQLHRILVDEVAQPFRFLDIACGDASASIVALKGTPISHYYGIDSCRTALELAGEALETLACPITLDQSDFVEALRDCSEPVHAADFPETASQWNSLGYQAGFGRVRELYVSPTDLFRVYCFEA